MPTRPSRRFVRPALAALAAGAAWALSACSPLHPERVSPGADTTTLLAAMGPASLQSPLPGGGQRWFWVQGPRGLQTWLADLDAQGRVARIEPALTPARFAQVQAGWTAEALLLWLGPPAERQRERLDRQTWSWRYDNPQCLWARITLSAQGEVLAGASFPMDTRCEVFERGVK